MRLRATVSTHVRRYIEVLRTGGAKLFQVWDYVIGGKTRGLGTLMRVESCARKQRQVWES